MKPGGDTKLSRRAFFMGTKNNQPIPVSFRPPWTSDKDIADHCTSCGDCFSVCPENILVADNDGMPTVCFEKGECTFCGACAQACSEPVFFDQAEQPWSLKVSISDSCLLKSGVTCQLCTDHCEAEVLRFNMRVRPSGAIQMDVDACTGCGACVAPCPVSAIAIFDNQITEAA